MTVQSDNVFGPHQTKLNDILINTLGAFIAGMIGSIVLFFSIFALGKIVDFSFQQNDISFSTAANPLFPFILSFVTYIISLSVILCTYFFLTKIDSERYKRSRIHFGNLLFFSLITFLVFIFLYVVIGGKDFDALLYIFIIHIITVCFGVLIILELLNNYRYILLGIYGSFMGLFLTSLIVFLIFTNMTQGQAKLYSLLFLLPLSNASMQFFKGICEFLYYRYFLLTAKDPLGDVFTQIEEEENEKLRVARSENSTY